MTKKYLCIGMFKDVSCFVCGGQTTVIFFENFNPLSIFQNIITR